MNTKKEWDKIYSSGKQINDYPYDFVVSATKKYIKNTNQSSINLVSNSLKQIDIQKSGIFFSWILIKFFSIYLLLDDLLKPNFRKEKESFKWPNKSSSYFKKILKKNKFTNQKIREIGPGIYLIA